MADSANEDVVLSGSCLCGGVSYRAQGPFRDVVACHCRQCQKTSGHYVAATQVVAAGVMIEEESLRWFRSSDKAERGFCGVCGSNLFWRELGSEQLSIFAGTLDQPTGLKMLRQIHVEAAGDYYPLPDLAVVGQEVL